MFEQKRFQADVFPTIVYSFYSIFIKFDFNIKKAIQDTKQKIYFDRIRTYLTEKLYENVDFRPNSKSFYPNTIHINVQDWDIINKLHLNNLFDGFEIVLKDISEPDIFYIEHKNEKQSIQIQKNRISKTVFLKGILND